MKYFFRKPFSHSTYSEPAIKEYVDGTLPFKIVNVINQINLQFAGGGYNPVIFDNNVSSEVLFRTAFLKMKFSATFTSNSMRFSFGEQSGKNVFYCSLKKGSSNFDGLIPMTYHSNSGDYVRVGILFDRSQFCFVAGEDYLRNKILYFYPEYECTLKNIIVDLWYV